MGQNNCIINGKGSTVIAQNLFLGSTITSFNNNTGWGGSSSSLNVELINDFGCPYIKPYALSSEYLIDDHYYNCVGDSCYIDEKLQKYTSNISKEKLVPGKLFHKITSEEIKSNYWTLGDPGFFGDFTRIDPQGRYDPNNWYSYNIIDCPVYFRFGYCTFGGFISSWDKTIRENTTSYSVNIVSPDKILSECKIILSDYSGAVFGRYGNFGSPINYTGPGIRYNGNMKQGVIPNVFNVYGFLESYGFGGSQKNENGIPITYILNALTALTSSVNISSLGDKQAFSPFGRIITKTPLTNTTSPVTTNFKDYSFGLLNPIQDQYNIPRSVFLLDLSEIPRPNIDVRFGDSSDISIADFIRMVCDKTGKDYYSTLIRNNGYNVIKIKTIDRTSSVGSNYIENIVEDLVAAGLDASSASFGKSSNECLPKVLYIGGNQQRLYQAKTRKLAYSQTTYVFHPLLNKFVDFKKYGDNDSSLKAPNYLSTKNTLINNQILGNFVADLWNTNESIRQNLYGDTFDESDINFSDSVVGGKLVPVVGNYFSTINYGEYYYTSNRNINPTTDTSGVPSNSSSSGTTPSSGTNDPLNLNGIYYSNRYRYIPIHNQAICPFFGFKYNEKASASDSDSDENNNFRFIRPVLHDSFTGQLVVKLSLDELPTLSMGNLPSIYSNPDMNLNLFSRNTTTLTESGEVQEELPPGGVEPEDTDPQTATPDPNDPNSKPNINQFKSRAAQYASNRILKITESEIRAAMDSFDSYVAYCLKKIPSEKPDLFLMLVSLYKSLGKLITAGLPAGLSTLGGNTNGLSGEFKPTIANVSNEVGQRGSNHRHAPIQDLDLSMTMHHEFMFDLKILVEFIANIGEEFYGKKYMVRIPELFAYQDKQYADISIPSSAGNISVYQGSGKIYYNKELADGAWEEFGNVIDDNIVVGSPSYYKLIDSNGLIKPIIGYNAGYQFDDAARIWCEQADEQKAKQLELLTKAEQDETDVDEQKKLREYKQSFMNRIGSSIDCEKRIVPSIDLSSLTSDYLLLDMGDFREDAFGRTSVFSSGTTPPPTGDQKSSQTSGNNSPIRSYSVAPAQKLYIPTTCSSIVYLDPYNLLGARVIIESPGVKTFSTSYAYTQDPNLTVMSTAAMEDMAVLAKLNLLDEETKNILSSQIIPITDTGFLVSADDTSNQSQLHATIVPKMAQPLFAAVPLKSNVYCYGPWTNYPALENQAVLFPGQINTTNSIEQLISNVKVEKKDEFVPWNTGGASYLDLLVLNTMKSELSYQTVVENGRISANGLPLFGIAGGFKQGITDNAAHQSIYNTYYDIICLNAVDRTESSYIGFVLSGISINVGSSDVTTNYNFSTYSPKLGLYNKENADRIKQIATSRISLYKEIYGLENKLNKKFNDELLKISSEISKNRTGTDLSKFTSKIYGKSPGQILIGKATNYIPAIENFITADPGFVNTSGVAVDMQRHKTFAGLYMANELKSEVVKEYNCKSMMSMDGLFSPISFYPTTKNTTYSLSSRCITADLKASGIICPKCGGAGIYSPPRDSKKYPCPMCAKSKLIFEENNLTDIVDTDLPPINAITLNPIVVPYGEFKNVNSQPSKNGERSRHSISLIGRSEDVPLKTKTLDINNSLFDLSDPKTGKIAIPSDYAGAIDPDIMVRMNIKNAVNKDYYETDLVHKFNTDENILLNQRFFGFRGPMMLHGWGYDTEGYPVPNMADEPLELNKDGLPKRFILTPLGLNDITRDGKFIPNSGELLGDIIGKGYSFEGGEWQKTKSRFFAVNWAERPDLWPVGPIDLRWDETRKVWSAFGGGGCTEEIFPPFIVSSATDARTLATFINQKKKINNTCPYKMIYAVLEEDMLLSNNMTQTHPARAFIDDIEYSLSSLTFPLRRLIYIKDRCGYTAPRGSKILCRYDTYSGFYEPITKPNYIVFGDIQNNNNAIIELSFIQGVKRSENAPRKSIVFDNSRFSFDTKNGNGRGMFMFENGSWILIGMN